MENKLTFNKINSYLLYVATNSKMFYDYHHMSEEEMLNIYDKFYFLIGKFKDQCIEQICIVYEKNNKNLNNSLQEIISNINKFYALQNCFNSNLQIYHEEYDRAEELKKLENFKDKLKLVYINCLKYDSNGNLIYDKDNKPIREDMYFVKLDNTYYFDEDVINYVMQK